MEIFKVEKYLGLWYQLFCYPSFFQDSLSYNTTAEYEMVDGKIKVTNTTYIDDRKIVIHGTAEHKGLTSFSVSFDDPNYKYEQYKSTQINYVINKIFTLKGNYEISIVSNPEKTSLFVLSRTKQLPLDTYGLLVKHLRQKYDMNKIVQTTQL